MNRIKIFIFILSMLICSILITLAYFANFELLAQTTNIVVIFLISLNIIANFFQIVEFIESHFIQGNEQEKEFLTKSEYNKEVIRELESHPKMLRAIVMGPYFLHPIWLINRRLELEDRESFSLALSNYLEDSSRQSGRKIRLIIRNSPRYMEYLNQLINPEEIKDLFREMFESLDNLIKDESISFCCMEVGFYENVIITEKSCFIYGRTSQDTSIDNFRQSKDENKIKKESSHFDKVFDKNYKGRNTEITSLKQFLLLIEQQLASL